MKYEGVTLTNSFPRTIFKQAFSNNLISEEKTLTMLLEDINITSHIYNEKLANEIAERIVLRYLPAIDELTVNLENAI